MEPPENKGLENCMYMVREGLTAQVTFEQL